MCPDCAMNIYNHSIIYDSLQLKNKVTTLRSVFYTWAGKSRRLERVLPP